MNTKAITHVYDLFQLFENFPDPRTEQHLPSQCCIISDVFKTTDSATYPPFPTWETVYSWMKCHACHFLTSSFLQPSSMVVKWQFIHSRGTKTKEITAKSILFCDPKCHHINTHSAWGYCWNLTVSPQAISRLFRFRCTVVTTQTSLTCVYTDETYGRRCVPPYNKPLETPWGGTRM